MQSPSTAAAFLVQSSNTGPAPALLASHPGIKNKEKKKKQAENKKVSFYKKFYSLKKK